MFVRIVLVCVAVLSGALIGALLLGRFVYDDPGEERILTVMPATPPASDGWTTEIRAERDGHFYVDAIVQTVRIRFMVDTGATMTALSVDDARRLNIRIRERDYVGWANTVGGPKRVARVNLDSVRIDDNWVFNVPAYVVEDYRGTSLLGLSFLRELEHYEFSNRVMTLHWN